jgi:hypothetical protein
MEAVVGVIVLVPIVFLAIDATCVLTANRSNQELAHNIARAAANHRKADTAEESARDAVSSFAKPALIHNVTLSEFNFDVQSKLVTVSTSMEVSLPVPCPGMDTIRLNARWSEPIVAIPAST